MEHKTKHPRVKHPKAKHPQVKHLKVAESLAGERLDVGLTINGATTSRSQSQQLIKEKKVWINGKNEKASYRLQMGDEIILERPSPPTTELIPYDFPLDVTYEDDQVMVVNKPAGLVVHPAHGHQADTLINALISRQVPLSSSIESFRPGLVHRLDKGTSGLLVIAKTDKAHSVLAQQFLRKTIHRRYWALSFSNKALTQGSLESYLSRDPKNRQRFQESNHQEGKWAITHYHMLHAVPPFRLFELRLETGRTHQIRVHLSTAQNPLVGDDLYHGKNQAKNLKNQSLKKLILNMERFALHAKELGFIHPTKREFMSFETPLPQDLQELFQLAGFGQYI